MPLMKIQFKPGVNRETTSYGNEGQWYNSDLIRFRKGRPEKMGGWKKVSSTTFTGVARGQLSWNSLDIFNNTTEEGQRNFDLFLEIGEFMDGDYDVKFITHHLKKTRTLLAI